MKKPYEIKFAARKYESQGKEKTFWSTHGQLWVEAPDGVDLTNIRISMKLDSIPQAQHYDGWFNVFEKRDREDFKPKADGFPPDDDLEF